MQHLAIVYMLLKLSTRRNKECNIETEHIIWTGIGKDSYLKCNNGLSCRSKSSEQESFRNLAET